MLILLNFSNKSVCMHSKELALPRASHSDEIALAGSRRLRCTLAAFCACGCHSSQKQVVSAHQAAPVLFAYAIVTTRVIGAGKTHYRQVPKFWTHGSVCCACAQRPGLPRGGDARERAGRARPAGLSAHLAIAPRARLRQSFSRTLRSQKT